MLWPVRSSRRWLTVRAETPMERDDMASPLALPCGAAGAGLHFARGAVARTKAVAEQRGKYLLHEIQAPPGNQCVAVVELRYLRCELPQAIAAMQNRGGFVGW